jgi:hypothetical protein
MKQAGTKILPLFFNVFLRLSSGILPCELHALPNCLHLTPEGLPKLRVPLRFGQRHYEERRRRLEPFLI